MKGIFSAASLGLAVDGAISRMVHDLTAPPPAPAAELSLAMAKYRGAREQTLAIIQDFTQAQADYSPSFKVWSIGQIVEHLILTETLYRAQIRKLIQLAFQGGNKNRRSTIEVTFDQIDNSMAFIPRDVIAKLALPLNTMNLLIPRAVRTAMFRFPLIPALNPLSSEPAPRLSVADLRARAVSSLNTTEEIFRGDLPLNVMDMTLRHPLLGANNVAELLGILWAHEERHHRQIRGVMANPRFPPCFKSAGLKSGGSK